MTDTCLHCGAPLSDRSSPYCCSGCETARALLDATGLSERFYALADGRGVAVPASKIKEEAWVTELTERLQSSTSRLERVDLEVQGLRCAACVWVVEKLFERQPGAVGVLVNPGLGKLSMEVDPKTFSLAAFTGDVGAVGYRLAPVSAKGDAPSPTRGLLIRLGVSAALAMNVMIFSFSLYSGLNDGPLHTAMLWGGWGLTAAAVMIGGQPFFSSAWASLKAKALHLDVPIALGIALAFGGSTWSMITQSGKASYFDTVASFVTLMLLGRFLQERVLEQNRRALLSDDGVENLRCQVIVGGQIEIVRVGDVKPGDTLLLRPGDLVPVDAQLVAPQDVTISREWISGESSISEAAAGQRLDAGSFIAGRVAAQVVAQTGFAASGLSSLLSAPRQIASDKARRTPFWRSLAKWYVAGTLTLATLGGAGWALLSSPERAIEVVVAVLVVTCPCAFGIAVPVAFELTQAGLRREGVFIRSASLLERAAKVRKVVFDKTGTLTLGALELASRAPLDALTVDAQRALYQMVIRSAHPKSVAVARALAGREFALDEGCSVEELAGRGVEALVDGRHYRLGAPGWAGEGEGADLVFGERLVTGELRTLAALSTRESMRREAARELAKLTARGFELHLLSGDGRARVDALAEALSFDPARAIAGASPSDKKAYIEQIDAQDTLMVGDGVNDAAAMLAALCAVTPAGDMPFLPARTDVYVQGPLVTGIGRLLSQASRLERVVAEAVCFGVAYNVLAMGASLAGLMSPLLAAILMPLSSLAVVSWVVLRMRGRVANKPAYLDTPGSAPITGVA